MIGADSVVMDEHHAHVFGTHPSLPESHVFGEGVILAVAVTGFESTFFVNEGCGPLIGNAPLVSVGFIIDQGGKNIASRPSRRSQERGPPENVCER
jgi:hypothetical protein